MAMTLVLLRFTFNSLTLQIAALSSSLYRTRRDLLALASLIYHDETARSIARVSIVKQWWPLVLDELRNRGRRV